MADSLGIFKQQKYKSITLNDKSGRADASHMSPASTDGLANNAEAVLTFFHVPSETDVFFKAFITTFAESYSSDWTPDTVFGRTDPIYTFKNTQRSITLGWKIPADTISEAYENLGKVQKLAQFLYPNYADLGNDTSTLSQSPLVRLKLMNLAQQSKGPQDAETTQELPAQSIFESYVSTNNPSDGLLGAITSMTVNHNLENPDAGVIQVRTNTVLPKLIEVNIDFAVIHEQTLGWNNDNTFKDANFPYNAVLESESQSVMSAGSYNEKIAARQAAERGRQTVEQAKLDAEARGYNGMFGKAYLKKDRKKMGKLADKIANGEELTERQQANYDYLSSAQFGYVAQAEAGSEEQGKRYNEMMEYIE